MFAKVIHSTIAGNSNEFLRLIWPEKNTLHDAAAYMCKAMRALKVLFPKMVYVTCLAHGLHRVSELVRANYPNVNRLMSTCKNIFLKAPERVEKFQSVAT